MKATVGTSFARYMKEKEDMLLKSEMKMDRYWFFRNKSIVRVYGEWLYINKLENPEEINNLET